MMRINHPSRRLPRRFASLSHPRTADDSGRIVARDRMRLERRLDPLK